MLSIVRLLRAPTEADGLFGRVPAACCRPDASSGLRVIVVSSIGDRAV
ncbi:hypothetical protein P355_4173 [Burkholderia cenocepacia KC-01]|nr:hypothetical protein P355_4173 [Burkholderia cenocepacia KC-01]